MIDRGSLFTDHRISSLPIRAKYKFFQNNVRAYFRQFSHRFQSFFEMMVVNACSWYSVDVVESSYLLTISLHNISSHDPSMSLDNEEILRFSEHGKFSVVPAEIRDSNMVR